MSRGAVVRLKSSYSAVMLNHYGAKFHEYAMPADWLATPNTLEKLCFTPKDVTLIIDDYRPSTDKRKEKAKRRGKSYHAPWAIARAGTP